MNEKKKNIVPSTAHKRKIKWIPNRPMKLAFMFVRVQKISKDAIHTILCLLSNRCFSTFAFSYSPFSRCRWSGLSLESVGGSFSLIRDQIPRIRQSYKKQLEMHKRKMKMHMKQLMYYIMSTCSPGVSSFSVIANDVKLYRVILGGLLPFHNKEASEKFGFPPTSPLT